MKRIQFFVVSVFLFGFAVGAQGSWWEYSYEADVPPEANFPALHPLRPEVQAGMQIREKVDNGVLFTETLNGSSYYSIGYLGQTLVWVPTGGLDNTLEIRLAVLDQEEGKPYAVGLGLTGVGSEGDKYLPLHFTKDAVFVGTERVEIDFSSFQVIRVVRRSAENLCEVYFSGRPDLTLVVEEDSLPASPRKDARILYGFTHAPSFGGTAALDYLRWTNMGGLSPDDEPLLNEGAELPGDISELMNEKMEDTAFPSEIPSAKSKDAKDTNAYESKADLSDSDVARFDHLMSNYHRFPLLAIPALPGDVKVDGRLDEKLWEDASALRGLANLSDYHVPEGETSVYAFHSNDRLYLGWRVERQPDTPVRASGSGRTNEIIWNQDDGLEFVFSPEEEGKLLLSVYVNATGKFAAGLILGGSGFDVTLESPVEAAALTENGVTSGELVLDLAKLKELLGAKGLAMRQEQIGFNVMQVDTFPGRVQSDWSDMWSGQRYSDAYAGALRLMTDKTAVRVQALGRVDDDKIGFRGSVRTAAPSVLSMRTLLWGAMRDVSQEKLSLTRSWDKVNRIRTTGSDFDEGADFQLLMGENTWMKTFGSAYEELDETTRVLESKKGDWLPFEFVRESQGGRFLLGVDLEGGEVPGPLWRQTVQFTAKRAIELRLVKRFLTLGGVLLEIDAQNALRESGNPDGARALVTIQDSEGKIMKSQEVALNADKPLVETVVGLGELPVGEYSAVVNVLGKDDQVLAHTVEKFSKPENPAWLGNRIGYTDEVPRPFEPIRASADAVSMWGRTYGWSPLSPLPATILSQGREVLAAPMELSLRGIGTTDTWRRTAWELKEAAPRHAVYEGVFRNGPFTLHMRVLVEFDGFMRFTGKIEGSGQLDSLILRVPVSREVATHYHASHRETDLRRATYRYTAGTLTDFCKNFPEGKSPWHGLFWVGGSDAGIQWIAEWDKGWSNPDRSQVMSLEETPAAAVLQASIVGQPLELEEPLEFDFAFNVSPVKDLADSWRHHVITGASVAVYPKQFTPEKLKEDAEAMVRQGVDMTLDGGYGFPLHSDIWIRNHNLQHWPEKSEIFKEAGLKRVYYGCWAYSMDGEEAKDFGDDMVKLPRYPAGENTFWYNPEGPWVDFFMAGLARAVDEYDVHGIYLDGMPVSPICADPHMGQSYVDEEGHVHGKWAFFALREWAHRMRNVMTITHTKDGLVYQHDSNAPNLAIVSLADIRCGGEETPGVYTVKEAYPLDSYRATMDSRTFGIKYNTIWYNWWKRPLKENHVLSVILLHGQERFIDGGNYAPWQLSNLSYAEDSRTSGRIAQLIRGEVVDAATADFWPYFGKKNWVQAEAPALASSMVHEGKSALVVVSNLETKPYLGKVKLDFAEIGLAPGEVEIQDAILGTPLDLEKGELQLEIEPQRYRLLSVTTADGGTSAQAKP